MLTITIKTISTAIKAFELTEIRLLKGERLDLLSSF
jgi:hypothetical protein